MQELEPSQVRSISSLAAGCPCCKHHPLTLDRIVVERGALLEAAPYLKERGYRQVALVSDENTYRAAGAGSPQSLPQPVFAPYSPGRSRMRKETSWPTKRA